MSSLITLADPTSEPASDLLATPGAFAWWYLDLVDEDGDGFVLIWSFGLPFLPGAPRKPAERPSLNLAIYESGRLSFYLLQELQEGQVEKGAGYYRFDRSLIASRTFADHRYLRAQLDCPIPGSRRRLTGEVELVGAVPSGERTFGGDHSWTPVTGPAHCRAGFDTGEKMVRFEGHAYHDRNDSLRPLDALGIDCWTWGRRTGPDGTLIYYVLWPEGGTHPTAWAVEIAPGGASTLRSDLTLEAHPKRCGLYGMGYAERIELFDGGRSYLSAKTARIVDDGPFYLRTLVRIDGATGFGEWVRPSRIRRRWHQPFVEMRVHRPGRPNSFWLPLFTGPRRGRLGRLLGVAR